MRTRRALGALGVACLLGVAAAPTTAAAPPGATAAGSAAPASTQSTATMPAAANEADADFVRMMIPHHHQALVMSDLVADGGTDPDVAAMADRIAVEQDLEIDSMQSWQGWNGLPVTDAEAAYQQVLQNPEMLEQMGMATPAELADLDAATGTAADVLFLELMIEHHEGALRMLTDVLVNGQDSMLQQMTTDMYVVQYTQIAQMEDMLDRLS